MPNGPSPATTWRIGRDRVLRLDRAHVMAILNVTPDSFSDGGLLRSAADALDAAQRATDEGADLLDIGGESTRPGALSVDAEEQIRRVVPAIEAIRGAGIGCPISVDTTLAHVASRALDAGAEIVNDVSAGLDDPEMLPLVAARGAGVILMHRLARPRDDSWSDRYERDPTYPGGVVASVRAFLLDRAEAAIQAGVLRESIAIDPGLGFGKSVAQNFELIEASADFVATGFPVIGAASRKSFLGAASGITNPADRVAPSVDASVAQRRHGVQVFRVHDVAAQRRGLMLADAGTD